MQTTRPRALGMRPFQVAWRPANSDDNAGLPRLGRVLSEPARPGDDPPANHKISKLNVNLTNGAVMAA